MQPIVTSKRISKPSTMKIWTRNDNKISIVNGQIRFEILH